MTPLHILFAPVLRTEGWLSIELQEQNILEALHTHHPEWPLTRLAPDEAGTEQPMRRRWRRSITYPRLIREAAAKTGGRCVLHVSDHSYGHLCRAHTPCVINCNDLHHFVEPHLDPVRLWLWRQRVRTMRHAARVLTISAHLAGEVCEHLRLPPEQVTALPGGIDAEVFHPMSAETTAQLMPQVAALRRDHLLVVNIGTNHRRKNLPTVLRAVRHLISREKLPVKLLKVGPALRGGEHEALIAELGIADHIIDLGTLKPEQVAAVCNQAHALAFASLYEGFGRPTLEAQACGLPCVLADASCMREVGGDGALYHVPLDHEELAVQLVRAMTDAEMRRQLVAAGLENVQRFSWRSYADKLVRVYQEVAA
ncbi:MAG: glycosyltransferase family 1 protein [Prosthecobacter sp.]|nr:glycosyltransferase family 1 protein [Prosthecobacter sp.]